jgi:histone-lysine N-methyltransferase ASH1L
MNSNKLNCKSFNFLGSKCNNQKIRKNQWFKHLEIFDTGKYGQGLRTTTSIPKGTFICEYVGEIITDETFHERMTNLYSKDEHHYTMKLTQNLVIDAYRMGSVARFANHSCSPNCEFQKWTVDGLQRMCMFSLRTIKPGEELTYDYNFQCFNLQAQQPCYCESSKCRGTIGTKQQPTPSSLTTNNNNNSNHSTTVIPKLTYREKRMVLKSSIFLLRNLRRIKQKHELRKKKNDKLKQQNDKQPAMSLFFAQNYYHPNGSNNKSTLVSLRKTPKLSHKGKYNEKKIKKMIHSKKNTFMVVTGYVRKKRGLI